MNPESQTESTLPEVFVKGWENWSLHWSTCTTRSENTAEKTASRCFFSKTWWNTNLRCLIYHSQNDDAAYKVKRLKIKSAPLNLILTPTLVLLSLKRPKVLYLEAPGFIPLYTCHPLSYRFKNALNITVTATCTVISRQHWTVQMFKLITK